MVSVGWLLLRFGAFLSKFLLLNVSLELSSRLLLLAHPGTFGSPYLSQATITSTSFAMHRWKGERNIQGITNLIALTNHACR